MMVDKKRNEKDGCYMVCVNLNANSNMVTCKLVRDGIHINPQANRRWGRFLRNLKCSGFYRNPNTVKEEQDD